MSDQYPTWIHVIAGLIGWGTVLAIVGLGWFLLAPTETFAQAPIPGSCGQPFRTLKILGSNGLGQDLCVDGTLTQLRTGPIQTDCSRICDWDDGTRRSTSTRCSGRAWVYEDDRSDQLCSAHGGVADSQWYVPSFFQDRGMWQGPNSPLTAGTLRGPDKLTCDCLSGDIASCVDYDRGPQLGGLGKQSMCHDVCGWEKGSLSNSTFYEVDRDSPSCPRATADRGPEVHCECEGVPLRDTWCSDDPSICDRNGCVLHHTSPQSTRCIAAPPLASTTTTTLPSECTGIATPATSALNWLRFAVGGDYQCVTELP